MKEQSAPKRPEWPPVIGRGTDPSLMDEMLAYRHSATRWHNWAKHLEAKNERLLSEKEVDAILDEIFNNCPEGEPLCMRKPDSDEYEDWRNIKPPEEPREG